MLKPLSNGVVHLARKVLGETVMLQSDDEMKQVCLGGMWMWQNVVVHVLPICPSAHGASH